jgi:hypothetical protein
MCRLLIASLPLLSLWSFWGSWIFTPYTSSTTTITATITTTNSNTLILTLTLPPTTRTVTAQEDYNLEHETFIREKCDYHEKLEREKIAREAAEEFWEARMRASWTKWFMDYFYKPLAYLFVTFVAFGIMISWD